MESQAATEGGRELELALPSLTKKLQCFSDIFAFPTDIFSQLDSS